MEVYIDGSDKGGRCGWACFWGDQSVLNRAGLVPGPDATCAKAEVYALHQLLIQISRLSYDKITIYCDNIYVVRGVNEWMDGWMRSNRTDIAHLQLWRDIWSMYHELLYRVDLKIMHVKAHVGIYGNEQADKMAKGELVCGGDVNDNNVISKELKLINTESKRLNEDKFSTFLTQHHVQHVIKEVPHGRQYKSSTEGGSCIFYTTGKVLRQGKFWEDIYSKYCLV